MSNPGLALRSIVFVLLIAALACGQATPAITPIPSPVGQEPAQGPPSASTRILIGTEYILIENPGRVRTLAGMLAPIGLTLAKPLPENFHWGNMQPSPDAAIDFNRLDTFVREFQAVGFSELLLALKSTSSWASQGDGLLQRSQAPKPEYMDAYAAWVYSIVERYDGDGAEDMPGLLFPVRLYEIGTEFSSYEPEPVGEYLLVLEQAYAAAHRASENVIVTHAAFLTTGAFTSNPGPGEYEAAFQGVPDKSHDLADIRQVLDRPDLFDVVNVHALGDPHEIEAIVAWLDYEMGERSYQKPIMISDTGTTPFIAWGPATSCDKNPNAMGRVIPPAVEEDRCRLADYFRRLVDGDKPTLEWAQAFSAADIVKKVVVAAEQGIFLINTAFTEDLLLLKLPIAQAGAGNSAWAGLVDLEQGEYRAGFYALQQLTGYLRGYESVTRLR
ncbi:MAG: hypothetical protein EPO32_03040, partial [Anaerolineae bacterium]